MGNPTALYENLIESLCRTVGIEQWSEIAASQHMRLGDRIGVLGRERHRGRSGRCSSMLAACGRLVRAARCNTCARARNQHAESDQ